MFCPPPDDESQNSPNISKLSHKNQRKKQKKKAARKNGVNKNKRKHGKLALTMSTWAENFTFAATWQLKHQLAYWKARAKALEYENGVLHDIIRKKNLTETGLKCSESVESESQSESDGENNDGSEEEPDGDEEFEVSEEFIQFLQSNAKYKEDARRERERLREKELKDDVVAQMEAGPSGAPENKEEIQKDLYGDKWQRISALEMSLDSQFINESDKDKPQYWPNIPFNFNFG